MIMSSVVDRFADIGPSVGPDEFDRQLALLTEIASRPAADIQHGWESVDRIESLHERMQVLELKVRELEALA